MKLFNRVSRPVLATVFAIILAGCNTKNRTSAASTKPLPYPLATCVVSGDKLGGDMGPPITFIYSNNGVNQEIKFCCGDCKPKFLKDPDKYLKIIQDAEAAQNTSAKN